MSRSRLLDRVALPAGLLLSVVLAALLRLPALRGDLWLDEIWSLEWAGKAVRGADVLLDPAFHHDNNHPLNTWFLRAMGGAQAPGTRLRLLSFASGLLAVGVAVAAAGRRGLGAALAAGLLYAGSFLGIVYSTEARGYGPAVAAALVGFAALDRFLRRGGVLAAATYAAACVAGLLAHLTFLHFLLAALAWSAWVLLRRGCRGLVVFGALQAVPLAALATLYFCFARDLQIGGGPPFEWSRVLRECVAYTVGGPMSSWPVISAASATLLLLAVDLRHLVREGRGEWIFLLCVLFLGPVVTTVFFRPEYLFPRYFLVALTFVTWSLARTLGRWLERGTLPALGAVLLLGASLAGSAMHVLPFLRDGRGHYREAVEHLVANTPGPNITVTSDQDFRNRTVLEYYARAYPDRHFLYVSALRMPAAGARWLIVHSLEEDAEVPAQRSLQGHTYFLEKHFGFSGPSGFSWSIYRRYGS